MVGFDLKGAAMKILIVFVLLCLTGCAYQHELSYTPLPPYCLETHRHGLVLLYLLAPNHYVVEPVEEHRLLPEKECDSQTVKRWYEGAFSA